MPNVLQDIQILRVGTWTGSRGGKPFDFVVTSKTLQDVVTSFAAISGRAGFRPSLKLGHTDAQKFFGQDSGFPSLGDVVSLRVDREVLYATVENVPDPIIDLIRAGRYKTVSVEVFHDLTLDGVNYSVVLGAVALLGAELPAVRGLRELARALMGLPPLEPISPAPTIFEGLNPTEITFMSDNPKAPEIPANVKAELDKLRADLAAMTQTSVELRAQLDAQKLTARKQLIDAKFDQLVSEARALPAQKEEFSKYAAQVEDLDGFAALFAPKVELGERGAKADQNAGSSISKIVDEKVKKLQAERKSSYSDAYREVIAGLSEQDKIRYANGE